MWTRIPSRFDYEPDGDQLTVTVDGQRIGTVTRVVTVSESKRYRGRTVERWETGGVRYDTKRAAAEALWDLRRIVALLVERAESV